MTQIEAIKEAVLPILHRHEVILYDVKWVQEGKMKILQVAIMRSDGSMDLDTCQMVSSEISVVLDDIASLSQEYYLEVCSAGAERELRSEQEIHQCVGGNVYLKLHQPVTKINEITGTLIAFDSTVLIVEYKDKQKKKQVEIPLSNVAFIRLAVTF